MEVAFLLRGGSLESGYRPTFVISGVDKNRHRQAIARL